MEEYGDTAEDDDAHRKEVSGEGKTAENGGRQQDKGGREDV